MDDQTSFATGVNRNYIEAQYQRYKEDQNSVPQSWQWFFHGYEIAQNGKGSASAFDNTTGLEQGQANAKVEAWINAYRRLGHLSAHLNPLKEKPAIAEDMSKEAHGLSDCSDDMLFHPANFGQGQMSLGDIGDKLRATYCGRVGADFRDISNIENSKFSLLIFI